MNEDLPEGWVEAPLRRAVVDIQTGFACGKHSRDSHGIAHLRPMNVSEDGRVSLGDVKYIERSQADRDARLLQAGDVLFNNTNSPELVGKTGLYELPEPRAFSNHMTRLRCDAEALDPAFCAHYLHHLWRRGVFRDRCNNHVSQASIGRDVLLDIEVRLPPLAEQKRIVEKVEALFEDVNKARDRLAKVPLILKRFRQSVLAAACSGRLTEDWRARSVVEPAGDYLARVLGTRPPTGADEMPDGWIEVPLGDLVSSLRMGTTVPPTSERTEYPVLRSSSVRQGTIDLDDVKYLQADESTNDDNFLCDGDLLFTRLSGSLEYVANCAVVPPLGGRRVQYPDRLVRAKLVEPRWGRYIEACFGSPLLRRSLEVASKSSAGHQRISMGALTGFRLPFPPVEEQAEIVRRMDALFDLLGTLETRVASATRPSQLVSQAVLAKAFAGQLVPTEAEVAAGDGRSFESATELLMRLSANGTDKSKPKRRGRKASTP
ncbi:MAG: restriction endonuclease subunit S [Sandaracinaceae bacterium]